MDSDFIVTDPCVGRLSRGLLANAWFDLLCRVLGHNLWRTGAYRPGHLCGGSLDVRASYCRRCFKGGYVQGDYR